MSKKSEVYITLTLRYESDVEFDEDTSDNEPQPWHEWSNHLCAANIIEWDVAEVSNLEKEKEVEDTRKYYIDVDSGKYGHISKFAIVELTFDELNELGKMTVDQRREFAAKNGRLPV